jgi:UDP-N-acetylglucosamine acyltransferase
VKTAYRIFYRDGLNRSQALETLRAHASAGAAEFKLFIGFIESSERGLTAGK